MTVVINGGGIVGLLLAKMLFKLTKGSLEIFVIETESFHAHDTTAFNKTPNVIALSRGAYSELIKIGLNFVLSKHSTIINQIEISEYTRFNKVFIYSKDYQLSELGYVVELYPIKKALFKMLSTHSMIHMCCPAKIQKIQRKKYCNVVVLNNGMKINAKLVIAADGSGSELATNCGIQWFQWNYQQTAIMTEIITEIPHFGTAFERFTPCGPLALLPMFNNLSYVIWCISNKKSKEVLQWSKDQFIQELQKIFGWRLGKILNVEKRYFHDLYLTYAKKHITHRVALVGNAAQTLHPVAGQGFNLGLRDAVILSKIICQSLCDNMDFGDYSVLVSYQKRRLLDQYQTINATDSLIRIFSNHYLPLVIVRNFSLLCVNYSVFLKRLLVKAILSWEID